MAEASSAPDPRPEPLFSLDLQGNGGSLAPATLDELTNWIRSELQFWAWANVLDENFRHHEGLKFAIRKLGEAERAASQASQTRETNPDHSLACIQSVRGALESAYLQRRLPHSSTPLASRINAYRKKHGDQAASFFASVFTPPTKGNPFQPQSLESWLGMVEGLIDRFDLFRAPDRAREQAAELSFEQLRSKAESLIGEKSAVYDALHRDYSDLAQDVDLTASEQKSQFGEAQAQRAKEFVELVSEHQLEMETLRKTFREEIALRAPATYWEGKRKTHALMAMITGGLSFAGIGGAAVAMGFMIHDLFSTVAPNASPEAWRVTMFVLVGVFTVWGLRLVVRMFLSHMHLATDAAERVVMTHTYLALMEGDQLADKDDRQLILQALFRPASDGIVKDEGVPFSFAEMLTRTGKP